MTIDSGRLLFGKPGEKDNNSVTSGEPSLFSLQAKEPTLQTDAARDSIVSEKAKLSLSDR